MNGSEVKPFSTTMLEIWNNIANKRDEYKEYTLLANELTLFGLRERRDEFKFSLELAATVNRHSSRLTKDILALEDHSDQLRDLLKKISDVATVAYEKREHHWRTIYKEETIGELKAAVTSFDMESARFNNTVFILNATVNTTTSRRNDLTLKISPSEILRINRTTYVAQVSYTEPGHTRVYQVGALVEEISYSTKNQTDDETDKAIQTLASKLKLALPHWNIPRLIGYEKNRNKNGTCCTELIFERPKPELEIVSLSELYRYGTPEPALNLRLRLCSQITIAVLQAYMIGLSHTSIRPQNLFVSPNADKDGYIDQASLILSGWVNAQLIEGITTNGISEPTVSQIIYQHPNRQPQESMAKEGYNIGYDIYSMGVCMLELLVWDPLVRAGDTQIGAPESRLSDAYQHEFKRLGYADNLDLSSNEDFSNEAYIKLVTSLYTRKASEVQNTLISMTKTYVPKRAGNRMANLIHQCLTCLDPESGPFTASSQDMKVAAENFRNEIFEDFNKLLAML
ncbi:hypothetical protein F5Y02DRAFT_427421 [Annulohypoxylon stygium]|nr:hypothetical protein F5Y02DRAFT_427421 [Annulohypoxylon stygium]